jgi:hypothetical protein
MNLNDLIAQQQATLNQYIQNAQHAQYGLSPLVWRGSSSAAWSFTHFMPDYEELSRKL